MYLERNKGKEKGKVGAMLAAGGGDREGERRETQTGGELFGGRRGGGGGGSEGRGVGREGDRHILQGRTAEILAISPSWHVH